jgi:hypothetical protein
MRWHCKSKIDSKLVSYKGKKGRGGFELIEKEK